MHTHNDENVIRCVDAGVVPYRSALRWQNILVEKRRKREIGDRLLLLEHPPVVTFGRRDASEDLLIPEEALRRFGIDVEKTDRGGRATYHGPGQLVSWLIFSLKGSIPDLVRNVEETVIRLLDHYRIEGRREASFPGIWIEDRKIAALGLHIDRGITSHGFALNVSCDLTPFRYLHPCGVRDRGVTSLERELGWRPSMREVKEKLLRELAAVFNRGVSAGGTFPIPPE